MLKKSRGTHGRAGDFGGKGAFGPVWREVSKELEGSWEVDRLKDGGLELPLPIPWLLYLRGE